MEHIDEWYIETVNCPDMALKKQNHLENILKNKDNSKSIVNLKILMGDFKVRLFLPCF